MRRLEEGREAAYSEVGTFALGIMSDMSDNRYFRTPFAADLWIADSSHSRYPIGFGRFPAKGLASTLYPMDKAFRSVLSRFPS